MRRIGCLVAAAFAASGAAGADTSPPAPLLTYAVAFNGFGADVPFARGGPHRMRGGLCVAGLDGSPARRLTGLRDDRSPSWSPDGTQVVFARPSDMRRPGSRAQFDLFVARDDGTVLGNLTRAFVESSTAPDWAPHGTEIAFVARDRGSALALAATDGSEPRFLVESSSGVVRSPSWSPDGRRIAFALERSGSVELHTVAAGGGDVRRVLAGADEPDWSPDGRRIAFVRRASAVDEQTSSEIAVVDLDGRNLRVLTATADARESAPRWSPDGSGIAFVRQRGGAAEIVFVPAGGREERVLVGGWPGGVDPAWRPAATQPVSTRGACLIQGTQKPDRLAGTPYDDLIIAGRGNDLVRGHGGNDAVSGGTGRDRLLGGHGNDMLGARDGQRDVLDGGSGRDSSVADYGVDRLRSIEHR